MSATLVLRRNKQDNAMTTRPDDVLDDWARGINDSETDRVLALYDVSCTLVPTFSPHLLGTPKEVTSYFEELASRPNVSVSFRPETIKAQDLGSSIFVLSGNYDFQFDVEDKPHIFGARFTFVIDTSKPRPIQHHHSSQIPEALS